MTLHHAHAPTTLRPVTLPTALRGVVHAWLEASKTLVAIQYRRPWAS